MQLLLPYAADETGIDGRSFPTALGQDLEKGLRTVARHFRIIHWAIQLLEQPRRRATRREKWHSIYDIGYGGLCYTIYDIYIMLTYMGYTVYDSMTYL